MGAILVKKICFKTKKNFSTIWEVFLVWGFLLRGKICDNIEIITNIKTNS